MVRGLVHAEILTTRMLLGHAVGGMCDVMIQDHPMGIKMGFARPFMASDVTSCLHLDKIQALTQRAPKFCVQVKRS